jgi:hypothetical protein
MPTLQKLAENNNAMPLTEKKAAHPANKNADKFNIFLNIKIFLRIF